jgi:hypothetical protein
VFTKFKVNENKINKRIIFYGECVYYWIYLAIEYAKN